MLVRPGRVLCQLLRSGGSVIAAFSITPLGVGEAVSEPVAEAVRLVRASGLPNETNAMFTNVEGEWDDVMGLIKACVMKIAEGAPRVSVVNKIDLRAAPYLSGWRETPAVAD